MFDSWVRKIPWRREWQLTPLFWPGEFHGRRSLAGYSPWGHKELDTTKRLTLSFSSFPFPLPLASLLFSTICKASSDNHFGFLNFFFFGMILVLPPVQYYEFLSIVL